MNEGAKLLLVTSYCYLAVFLYESAMCSVYGIPIELININTNNFLVVGTISLVLFFMCYQLINSIIETINIKHSESLFKKIFIKHGIFLLVGILASILSNFYWVAVVFLFIYPLVYLLFDLIPPLFLKEGSYKDRLIFFMEYRSNEAKEPDGETNQINLKTITTLVAISFYPLSFLSMYAHGYAERKESYPVNNNQVLLRVYGEYGITSTYSPKTNILSNQYKIISITDYEFEIKKIGRLVKPEI